MNMLSATRINVTMSTVSTSQLCEMRINKLFQNLKKNLEMSLTNNFLFKLRQLQQEFQGFLSETDCFCTRFVSRVLTV